MANITNMNENGGTLRKKYNVSLMKRYFSDKISQELDCVPKVEEKTKEKLEPIIYFEKLPDEIMENILVLATMVAR